MVIDWTQIFKKYKGELIALKDDEKTVVASGRTAKEALAKAVKKGSKSPILTRIPSKLVSYVGSQS